VLLFGGLLRCQLVVQVELRTVHRLGRLLGLAGQFAEFRQRVIGRVGEGICGKNA
jgi:hypothetical protein